MIDRIVSEIRFRVRTLFGREAVDRELDAELRFHIAQETEKLERMGVPREEAARRAHASFGGVTRIRDDVRAEHGVSFVEQAMQDVRYASRILRARKAFAGGVILTLGLAIGANATMFGIVDRLLLRAPPTMREQETVHRIYRHRLRDGVAHVDRNFSYAAFLDIQGAVEAFDEVSAFQTRQLAVGEGESAREVPVTIASGSFFRYFDAQPQLGRFFNESDDQLPTGTPVAVLGYSFWQSEFGGRNDIIGKTIRVDRTLTTIIGVAPREFVGMSDQGVPALYVPITSYAYAFRGNRYPTMYGWSWLEIIARRKSSVALQVASADLTNAMTQSWRKQAEGNPALGTPEAMRVRGELTPVQMARGPQASRDSHAAKWVSGVSLIVLLIACANVANLLLSRAVSRRKEIAVRLALGVSRARLTRQLLTESLLLALLGGTLGLAIAQWGAAGLRRWFLPGELQVSVVSDGRTLVFTIVTTLAVAMLTGLAPVFHARRADIAVALKSGARDGAYRHARIQTGLLVFQVALSAVLLVGGGLFVRSLRNVQAYPLGYEPSHVLVAAVNSRGARLDSASAVTLNDNLLNAAKSLPGVTHASLAASIPFWSNEARDVLVQGIDSLHLRGTFILQAGSAEYFSVMGTRILRGRAFTDDDRSGSPRVAVISERMARIIWGDRDALGQCFRLDDPQSACITVIGIAEDMQLRSFADARECTYYLPIAQYGGVPDPQILLRVRGLPQSLLPSVRSRLQQELSGAAYVVVKPLAELVDPNFRAWQFGTAMFVAFGGLALVLAAIGLYSIVAYDVAQRTRDLGIRIALGASKSRVLRFVVGRSVALIAIGVGAGLTFAFWTAPYTATLLFEQAPRDPLVFVAVTMVLLIVGWLAAMVPAVRASRVDPNTVLRGE